MPLHPQGLHLFRLRLIFGMTGKYRSADKSVRSRVIMTIYNPISENLIATEPGNGGEAKGNCVAVRLGGEQPGAKEQSQTKVNSIRCRRLASLRVNGEASAKHDPGPSHPPATVESGSLRYGWSENVPKEVYVNGESCMDRPRRELHAMQQSEPPYERRSRVTPMEQREVGK